MRKPAFCICENKDAYQLHDNCAADQRLCFHYTYIQSMYYLNPQFQASSHLLWLYRPFCVGPSRKPRRSVFSQQGSCIYYKIHSFYICIFYTGNNLMHVSGLHSLMAYQTKISQNPYHSLGRKSHIISYNTARDTYHSLGQKSRITTFTRLHIFNRMQRRWFYLTLK